MLASSGYGNIPPGLVTRMIGGDLDVAAWTGGY
jgi:hypothetical protein